ncbi:EF-hand domain-containing protein [Bdellovibrio sp. HCB337]|uniref:EF-hand domain-containing protein n=1 Tax=Bdellovibrio sp. HCB337 TaxID=3394358 RepID=UPI0039A4C04C
MKTLSILILLLSFDALAQSQATSPNVTKKATAAPMSVNTGAANSANFQSVVFAGQAGRGSTGRVNFVVKNTCFGTNLRSVQNPLSPLGTIQMIVSVRDINGAVQSYWVKYPASSVTAAGSGQAMELDPASVSSNSDVYGALVGNVLRFQTPLTTVANVDGQGSMKYSRSGTIIGLGLGQEFRAVPPETQPKFPIYGPFSNKLCTNCGSASGAENYLKRALPFKNKQEGNSFFVAYPLEVTAVNDLIEYNAAYQNWYNWFLPAMLTLRAKGAYPGPYMGLPGPLSAHLNLFNSKDGKTLEINAAFPGQEGYCGGYHSPLMVFFDNKRPKFTATVAFPINPAGKTMWPEAGSAGAFIAYDRAGDGLITRDDEIFGNSEKHKNGFEALRPFDTNKDNMIDAQDKEYDKLLLWHDKNGDGFTQPGELSPLKDKIKSVSLKYNNKETTSFGSRAEVRERSTFVFYDEGKEKTGDVLDIWFSPVK